MADRRICNPIKEAFEKNGGEVWDDDWAGLRRNTGNPDAPFSGWTWEINKAWLDGAIDSRLTVQILTPADELATTGTLWREFNYLISKGYRLENGVLVPPPLP